MLSKISVLNEGSSISLDNLPLRIYTTNYSDKYLRRVLIEQIFNALDAGQSIIIAPLTDHDHDIFN